MKDKKMVLYHRILQIFILYTFLLNINFSIAEDNYVLNIRVGAYDNRPKIYTNEFGQIEGLFPDVLNDIAQQESWKINYVYGSWNECLSRLDNNDIDIMVDVAFSTDRAQRFKFNEETFLVNWATVYSKNDIRINSLIDLKNKRIAVMKGSIHTDGEHGIKQLLQQFAIDCEFVEVDNYKDVLTCLSNNQADAGVVNRIFGSLFFKLYDVKETPIIFNPSHIKFAFPKQSSIAQKLIDRIDYNLAKMKENPNSIYNKAMYVYLSGFPRKLIFTKKTINGDNVFLLTHAEKEWIRNHPHIRFGVDPEFAPFEYLNEKNELNGISFEYISLINNRLGLNMQVVKDMSWNTVISNAKSKKIDVLPCVSITNERKKFLKFSTPYIHFYRAIITRTDMPFLTGIHDIEHMTVAVQENSSHKDYLLDQTSIQPKIYQTLKEALYATSNGEVQAFVGNIASAAFWIRKLNLVNLKIAAPTSQEAQTLHFAVRNDWPELISIINKGLSSLTQKEERAIRKRWVNVEYKPGIDPGVVWRYILQIVGASCLIFLLFLFWNFRLKKEIKKRIQADRELNKANQRLKKLDQLKSMFIASMSHELRTPLNSIIGFTGILLLEMTGPLNDKQKDHLTRVNNSAKHLLNLITDVIDISKIEAGKIDVHPKKFMLAEIIEEAIIAIEPQLKSNNLTLQKYVPDDIQLYTDKKRLLQSLINYLSNAFKYTEKGFVRISAELIDDKIKVSVKDTGIGISQDDIPKLFNAFERLESHLKIKAGGTGLGLYLIRKLVTEILGGEVFVDTKIGQGSTFGLIIPKSISLKNENENDNP
jgi:signal transduction histidine kinase